MSYSDGTSQNLGKVTGENGADSKGIANATINSKGELILSYSDGTSQNLGKVTGENGADGNDGVAIPCAHSSYSQWSVIVEATCTANGVSSRTCTECGHIDYKFTPAAGHDWSGKTTEIIPATCTQTGLTVVGCANCDMTKAEPVTVAHSYVDGVCANCGRHEYEDYFQFMLNADRTGYRFSMNSSGRNIVTGVVSIPAEHDGLPVTELYSNAFFNYRYITKIIIPDSVTTLGISVFGSCTDLSIVIPKSVTVTERRSFLGCTYESIVVEEGNPVYHSDGNCLIATDEKRIIVGGKNSVIPSDGSVTSIGNSVPGFVISVFSKIDFDELIIPEGVESITDYAFSSCNIGTLKISSTVSNISTNAFSNCKIDDFVVNDGNEFYESTGNCLISTKLQTLLRGNGKTVIPADGRIKTIAVRAFANCDIASVDIPDGVLQIGQEAFYGCSNLSEISLPDSVEYIEDGAFGATAFYQNEDNWDGDELYIGKHLIKVKNATGNYSVKEGTLTIAGSALNATTVESVVIPDSVKSVGSNAFSGCLSLKSVVVGNGVKKIGIHAFGSAETVEFKDTEGWVRYNSNTGYLEISSDDISDGAAAAKLLAEPYIRQGSFYYVYSYYVWYKTGI